MKLLETIYDIILLEFNEKFINSLVDEYKLSEPNISRDIFRFYINRFKQIQDSPNVKEKNITKYTWKELEKVVDNHKKRKIKTGKIDTTVTDSNLIYNENGLRLYSSNSLESCIKYGNGYRFCISSRGLKNQYHEYRIHKGGTIYFLFNDNLSKKMNDDESFENPQHVLVIIVYKNYYTVTDARNRIEEEKYYNLDELVRNYPWVNQVREYLVPVKQKNFDTELLDLKRDYNRDKNKIETLLQDNPNDYDLISKLDELTKKFRFDVTSLRMEFNKF
jgi:hypothetical protein